MSRKRTGSSEQPAEYYNRDWNKRMRGEGKISVEETMKRRTYVSQYAAEYVVGDSVLDFCCGTGHVANMIDNRKYLGIDFSISQIEWAREHCLNPNAQFMLADVQQVSDIGRYDTTIIGQALEHFEDPEQIVGIAHQFTKRRIVITLPTKNGSCHVWENFEEEDIRELLGDGDGGTVTVCEAFKCLKGTDRWVAVKELYPRVLVTGAGGFIGFHLVEFLKKKGYWVRGVDIREPQYAPSSADEFQLLDLRDPTSARQAVQGVDWVFSFASDHGGIGHISTHPAQVLWNNAMINLQTIRAAHDSGVEKYFFSSSVCVYPRHLKTDPKSIPLKESDVFPAYPEHDYGWEKLFTEIALHSIFGEKARIARFHTIYGPLCEWDGGKEKVPPALARKVAIAELTGTPQVEIWGDGKQTRTFCYIDDCLETVYRLMLSDHCQPLNIGSDRLITIDTLADMLATIAGVPIEKVHISGPVGEKYRGADLSEMYDVLDYKPQVELEDGLAILYKWVKSQVIERLKCE